MAQEHDLGIKTDDLPITTEAKVFYLANCLRQGDYVEVQLQDGVDPPQIRLDIGYLRQYLNINDLAQRDMDLMIEELREIGVADDD